jgi:hypothetical protein
MSPQQVLHVPSLDASFAANGNWMVPTDLPCKCRFYSSRESWLEGRINLWSSPINVRCLHISHAAIRRASPTILMISDGCLRRWTLYWAPPFPIPQTPNRALPASPSEVCCQILTFDRAPDRSSYGLEI